MKKPMVDSTISDLETWMDAHTWTIRDIFTDEEAGEVRQWLEDKRYPEE